MAVLVVGSVAYDSVQTPAGRRDDALGGSATYFAIACARFAPVSVVGVVGEDFRKADLDTLRANGVDVSGLDRVRGRTFRWAGVYRSGALNQRDTLDTQLNVFADFRPSLTDAHRELPYLFLANIAPSLQLDVLRQMARRPKIVALDTMDYWIDGNRSELEEAVRQVDVVFMDERESMTFTGEDNVMRAALALQDMGPRAAIVKRGEYGALMAQKGRPFAIPAQPLTSVIDPTGAGDSFAGGFMGYLAACGEDADGSFRRAAVAGAAMGAFAVEGFSLDRLAAVTYADIETRFRALTDLTRFEALAEDERLPARTA